MGLDFAKRNAGKGPTRHYPGLLKILCTCLVACTLCLALTSCGVDQKPQAKAATAQEQTAFPIVYKLRGGKMPADAPKTLEKGQVMDVDDLPKPTRSGYSFQGWYTDASYATPVEQLEGQESDQGRVLVAKWKLKRYSIRYVTLGGQMPDAARISYTVKTGDFTFDAPTRARFEFQGWFTDPGFTNQVSGLAKGSTGNRVYYAKWSLISGDEYFFSQNDKSSDWWDLSYWRQRVGGKGCGLVSYTMAIDILTGANLTPADMYYLRGGANGSWNGTDAMPNSTKGARMTHKEWSERNFGVTMRLTESYPSNQTLQEGLEKGHVYLISRGGSKCFKDAAGTWHYHGGHYVLLYRYDAQTSTFFVHDPSGNTVQQQRLNQAVPYSQSDMRRCINSRSFVVCEMWVKEGMDPSEEDLDLYASALEEQSQKEKG